MVTEKEESVPFDPDERSAGIDGSEPPVAIPGIVPEVEAAQFNCGRPIYLTLNADSRKVSTFRFFNIVT